MSRGGCTHDALVLGEHVGIVRAEPLSICVDPSMSVNRKVTVPVGSSLPKSPWILAQSPTRGRSRGPLTGFDSLPQDLTHADLADRLAACGRTSAP